MTTALRSLRSWFRIRRRLHAMKLLAKQLPAPTIRKGW